MGEQTGIEWCDHTFNPWLGCAHVSPGCVHCYAETLAKRTGRDVWGKTGRRQVTSDEYWKQPIRKWNPKAEAEGIRRRVFCGSMCDVFEDRDDLRAPRRRLFSLINQTPQLDWLLLTKRPEMVEEVTPLGEDWPLNIWLGTSVEDQKRADERIPKLLEIPAAVRFLSCEPLLGKVDINRFIGEPSGLAGDWTRLIDWVIAGGESGPKARPMHPDWARALRDQCVAAGVPFLFKQWGEWAPDAPMANGVYQWQGGHAMANDGTLYQPGDLAYPDGPRHAQALRAGHDRAHLNSMYRRGKKAAGRILDDRTWDQFPESPAAAMVPEGRLL